MKQRHRAGKRLLQPANESAALSPTERGELNRQGAKAAARGDTACSNPLDEQINHPVTTGEAEDLWDQRREAWQDGHDLQSRGATLRRVPTGPRAVVRASTSLSGMPPPAASTTTIANPAALERQLRRLHLEIEKAQGTLEELQGAIAEANSEECLRAVHETTQENERLHEALHEQSMRAAKDADTATAALEDAVRVSETDPLTQLPNRLVLWDRLAHDIALAKRRDSSLAVLYLDLDGFKGINDRLGHEVGDLLLQHIARILLETMRTSDTVCRVGGDEFVIVASDIPRDELPALKAKISRAVAVPVGLQGHTVSPSVSIGSASFPADGDRPDTLVRAADAAMYAAKRDRS